MGSTTTLVMTVWLVLLSGWMFVIPGSDLVRRRDVLFQSDTGYWIEAYGPGHMAAGSFAHPLFGPVWQLAPRGLSLLLRQALPNQVAHLLAGRVFTGLVAGTGAGLLFAAASGRGLPRRVLAIGLAVYALSTSQVLVCLPEHFGISHGLLSATFAVVLSRLPWKARAVLLSMLAAAVGGVTITNAVFPLAALAVVVRQEVEPGVWRRLVVGAGAAAVLGLIIGAGLLHANPSRMDRLRWRVGLWTSARPLHDPAGALTFAVRGLIDPVIGPTPVVERDRAGLPPMVTYQPTSAPYRLWPYDRIQSCAAATWLLLLGVCGRHAWANPAAWPHVGLLVFWLAFNTVLHSVWGDEYFLFSPHWSWALLALVLVGMESVSWVFLAACAAVLAVGQVHTLVEIRRLLATIV